MPVSVFDRRNLSNLSGDYGQALFCEARDIQTDVQDFVSAELRDYSTRDDIEGQERRASARLDQLRH